MAKEKNEYFHKIYEAKWTVHFDNGQDFNTHWHSSVWRQLFAGKLLTNLPVTSVEQSKTVWSSDLSLCACLKLKPSGIRGSRKHRVFIQCTKCGKDVQAGRIAQHRC